MSDKPLPDDDKLPEADAEERFNRTLRNLLNTPHKPHKDEPKTARAPKAKGAGA
jgi:hypothetical protein